ncbi:hypothetical protein SO802_015117 [Lithocarpus litseifolius]|uniref:Uncharacterized protein n=1 Tax=Lithocarpus litseifolius TaxID=425828 RepID=A0AAW2CWD2_9ROSI
MVPRFEILLDCNNKVLGLKKEDATWVPTDWANYMDPDAMTTFLRHAICNIVEEECWEACQHALKSPYELRANDKDEEGGAALSDDDDGSDDKSDSSGGSSNNDSGHDDDDSDSESNNNENYDSQYNGNDWGEPPSDREDEDADLFYEEYDNDVAYYDQDIENDVEANRCSDTDSEQYRMINVLEDASEDYDCQYSGNDWGEPPSDREDEDTNLFYEDYDNDVDYYDEDIEDDAKANREILELGSYYDSELVSPTPHTEEEDDIDARLATLDQKLMVHSLRIMTLENAERNNEKMERGKSEHLPQHTHLSNKGKHDLCNEWMESIEHLHAFMTDKPTNIEIDKEATDYMDEDPTVLMLKEEGTNWETPSIIEATTELKNWAWEGAAHPMENSLKKIKTVKPITLAKKVKTIEPVTPAQNIVFVPIESISASISNPVKSVCESFPVESDLVKSIKSVESVESSFSYNMISDSTYLLALNVFFFFLKLVKKLLMIRN